MSQKPSPPDSALEFLGLLACFGVASVYLLPQILAWHSGFEFSYLLKMDEPVYAARVVRFLQGFWKIGNPWIFEHRNDLSLLPPLPEWTLGSLSAFLCISVDTLTWLSRGLLSALGTWVFWRALMGFGMAGPLALISAVWAFADPGVYSYKPLEPLWNGLNFHPLNRFSNPLFGLPLFLMALAVWSKIFLEKKVTHWVVVSAGILLGLLFYVSVYYWTHLIGALAVAAFLVPAPSWKERRKALLIAAIVCLGVALPYWLQSYRLHELAVFPELFWRTGIMVHDRGWYLLTHKALWLFTLGLIPLLFSQNAGQRYLGASIFAGVFCFFSSPITGVTVQNFHWNYTLAPLCFAGAAWLLSTVEIGKVSFQRASLSGFKWPIYVALLLPLTAGWVGSFREFKNTQNILTIGLGAIDHSYAEAWRWLKKNASADSVVLADVKVMGLVPLRTGLRIWQDSPIEMATSQEVLERNQLIWYLEGISANQLVERLAPSSPDEKMSISQWCAGVSSEILAEMRTRGYPVITEELNRELAQKTASLQEHLSEAYFQKIAGRYRMDYLVRNGSEDGESWTRVLKAFSHTHMEKVFDHQGIRIYHFMGSLPSS
jgi:hypothetical protein